MTVKKFRLFLASDVQKEEKWLTEMSAEGLHFRKNRFGIYYFDEDPNKAYVYQIDFQQNIDKTYFQLYEDAGWEAVDELMRTFHYFRREADATGAQKIYSDQESMKESFRSMMKFYIVIFVFLIASNVPTLLYWQGYTIQKVLLVIHIFLVFVYIYIFVGLLRKIRSYSEK